MYSKRVKIFIIAGALLLLLFLLRLIQMQLLPDSSLQEKITELKLQRGKSHQLKTVRGKILDRNAEILAFDQPRFQLNIDYSLSCFADERVIKAKLLKIAAKSASDVSTMAVEDYFSAELAELRQVIDKSTGFGITKNQIENRIKQINDRIWNLRTFFAWLRNQPSKEILKKYDDRIVAVPISEAVADFEAKFPDPDRRLLLINRIDDIAEMTEPRPLFELETDDDIFTAQLEFMNIKAVHILPHMQRIYPFGSAAAQTIGWVGPVTQEQDKQLFERDRLSRYLAGELAGREDGIEYACEPVLRGRRGEIFYDIDGKRTEKAQPQFGRDVTLTLDIELQQSIEKLLTNCDLNPNFKAPSAAVVIDVTSCNILAMVSTPFYDLNRVRFDYSALVADPNEPLRNRAINKQYPPGSVIKPLILIAALQISKTTPHEVITCPAEPAPAGWPNCWIYNGYKIGHDSMWENYARNAIKGSCNIYFSRIADRIPSLALQRWLYDFGYGRKIPLTNPAGHINSDRELREVQGQISTEPPAKAITSFEQLPSLNPAERRYFGIGQGNLRVTTLQVAGAMATLARGGVYKYPRLLIEPNELRPESVNLEILPETLNVIYDGMRAVVEETGGTANKEFAYAGFHRQDVTVYGKTGSTEKPDNAWFAGFAKDSAGRSIAVALVIEGGQRGSSDAAPLARDIIQFCIETDYIGKQ